MGRSLSDYNDWRASVVSRNYLYSDIDPSFTIHPVYNDILPIVDLDAIRSSIRNLVLTNNHERLFQPQLGSGLRSLLFENANPFTTFALKDAITNIIQKYEPRVSQVSVSIIDNSDRHAYQVTISFVASFDTIADVTFYLYRIR